MKRTQKKKQREKLRKYTIYAITCLAIIIFCLIIRSNLITFKEKSRSPETSSSKEPKNLKESKELNTYEKPVYNNTKDHISLTLTNSDHKLFKEKFEELEFFISCSKSVTFLKLGKLHLTDISIQVSNFIKSKKKSQWIYIYYKNQFSILLSLKLVGQKKIVKIFH